MLKTFNFLTVAFIYLLSLYYCGINNKIQKSHDKSFTKNIEKVNFSGIWNYEFNSNENEQLNKTFELDLSQNKDIIKGQYCAVVKGGRKIDCNNQRINNISGVIKGKIAFIDFTGFYDSNAKGKAKLYFDSEGNLVWEILEIKGEIYAPKKVTLKSNKIKNNDLLEGMYTLNSCENSRFKIKIKKTNSDYLYSILDKTKTILKGKTIINKTQIKFGKIDATISEGKIIVENFGNSTNNYNHFTQCDEKYLEFIKN